MVHSNLTKPRLGKPEDVRPATLSPELQLRRVLARVSRERRLAEDLDSVGDMIAEFVPKISAVTVAALALEARKRMKLRRVALFMVREMARYKTHRSLVADTLPRVIQRADELAEFVAIYWKDGRVPLSAQVKKGLATAFPKFDEHELAKCDKAGPVRLRDVLFLCHAKPRNEGQAAVWKKLTWGRLRAK